MTRHAGHSDAPSPVGRRIRRLDATIPVTRRAGHPDAPGPVGRHARCSDATIPVTRRAGRCDAPGDVGAGLAPAREGVLARRGDPGPAAPASTRPSRVADPAPTPRNRAPRTIAPLLAVLALLGLAACSRPAHHEPGEPPPPVRSRTAVAERREVANRVELQGTVEAERRSSLAVRVMATVTEVAVEEGDRVAAGRTLLRLDPGTADAQVAQARGAVAQAEAALALARRNHERFEALATEDAASGLEADVARSQLEQAEGAVEQAQAALRAAGDVAGDTLLTAPFSGRVADRLVDPGDLAAPGRPLLVLESDAARRLVLHVPESLFARADIEPGTPLPVALDALPDLALEGTVAVIGAGPDPQSHTVRVELLLAAEDVPSGAAGRAWLPAGRREVVIVPAGAILRRGGLEQVVLVTGDGTTATRVVSTGGAVDGGTEVLSGLEGGETVLLGLAAPPPTGSPVDTAPESP